MDDLISRSALMKNIAHHGVFDSIRHVDFDRAAVFEWVKNDMFRYVQDAPSVDAVPVVHGRWDEFENTIVCSACGEKWSIRDDGDFVIIKAKEDLRFCPSCGARMYGEENAAD